MMQPTIEQKFWLFWLDAVFALFLLSAAYVVIGSWVGFNIIPGAAAMFTFALIELTIAIAYNVKKYTRGIR